MYNVKISAPRLNVTRLTRHELCIKSCPKLYIHICFKIDIYRLREGVKNDLADLSAKF